MSYKSLIINPGSTSTKIGVFEDETLLFEETLRHSTEEIAQYASIVDQKDFRKNIIVNLLKEKNFDMKELSVVVGRGGMLKPIPGGTYKVTDDLLNDLRIGKQGQHASNLGGILAREIGDELGVPSFIVDPVVVDELAPVARYSGCPELPRTSVFHALNQKAVAKRYAKESGQKYEDLNLIVVHMGGGVSVGAHKNGKVVDVFYALDGDVDSGVLLVAACRAADVRGAARRRDLRARRVQAARRRDDADGVFLKVHIADEGERRCVVARDLGNAALVGAGDGHGGDRGVERDGVAGRSRFVADVVAHLYIDRLQAVAVRGRNGFCCGERLPRRICFLCRRLCAPDLHLVAGRRGVGD